METTTTQAYDALAEAVTAQGLALEQVEESLRAQRVETPSWGYGNSGTRFKVFPQPGVPRDPFEKFEDAAEVQKHTGVCPGVAIHIPWDKVDDYGMLRSHAEALGMQIGAVNPNLFQDEQYKLGSVCHPDAAVRKQATAHLVECVEIARQTGSDLLSLWFADGTNYAGQDSLVERRHRMLECLSEMYGAMSPGMRMLLEYKFYEPAFYHTDLSDWGTALTMCQKLGEQAQVLVDFGHHAQGVNVEHIVAVLLDEGRLGGFHFNNRKYGDDDLIVGSVNPFELFLIYVELVGAGATAANVAYMIDQSHNIEQKIEAMILSVTNLQEAYARALLVDRDALEAARRAEDVLGAHRVLLDAYNVDVRPLCAKVREDLGASTDPIPAFRRSGYLNKIAAERIGGTPASWT
ncbi:MAG: L-rhamnose isomerase [Chloroflexota bacterium]|nr:L-rhamnose isomerase [Chloroflexota bacterium]